MTEPRDDERQYRKRRAEGGDPMECDSCHYPGRLAYFRNVIIEGGKEVNLWLCEVCSQTHLSQARTFPSQCPDCRLYESIAALGNILLEAIRAPRVSVPQKEKELP